MRQENSINLGVQQRLLQKISKRERIHITSGKHERISFSILFIYIAISFLIVFFLFYQSGLDWRLTAIIGGLFVLFFPLYFLCRKIADVTVKGDALLINQFSCPCKVTSLKSVRNVKTRNFYFFSLTTLTFILDGNRGKVFLVEKLSRKGDKMESIIRFIVKEA